MNLHGIAKMYLEDRLFDGLYNTNECGCVVDDLMPCGEPSPHCHPGYNNPKKAEEEGSEFWIGPDKNGGTGHERG
jgi:hypothetical protein